MAGMPPFQGGAAGYVAYEYGQALENLPSPKINDLNIPDDVPLALEMGRQSRAEKMLRAGTTPPA